MSPLFASSPILKEGFEPPVNSLTDILRLKDCQIGIHKFWIIREIFERASTNHKKSSTR